MKLPKTFRLYTKYTEKKVYELAKKYKKNRHKLGDIDENITLENRIIIHAKEVAKTLGKLTGNTYLFTDKKNNLMISYEPSVAFQDIQLLTIQKQGVVKREYLFKSVKWDEFKNEEIRVYVPGDWQAHLDKLYKKAQQK